jgi:hypothetical protein
MLILEIVVAWCILSVPAALLIGAVLYRSGKADVMRPREASWEPTVRAHSLPV